jgi:sulfotransferase family protein
MIHPNLGSTVKAKMEWIGYTVFRRLRRLWVSVRKEERFRKAVTRVSYHIARQRLRIKRLKVGSEGPRVIRPDNMVWIFGSGRTGSTWLSGIMGSLPRHTRWHEPLVGYLFGHAYQEGNFRNNDRHFIFGGDRRVWLSSIRSFVLDQATARFPQRLDGGYLVVKEPHGSLGAPLLMEALPESRMVFLVRHPGDVVSSALDAHRRGSWAEVEGGKRKGPLAQKRPDRWPDRFVNSRSRNYLRDIECVKQAYEAHKGRKVLVKYEDLKADTLGTMKRVYSALGIPVGEGALARAVEKHSWENIPEEEKGERRFYRKATPGAWREDLTSEQVRIVEEVTRPLLEEFYL